MKNNLLFDFIVDKENKTVKVTREFEAPQTLVWRTWTEPELLDQWWGPKPYNTITESMDFKEGGKWFYKMVGPDGDEHWNYALYTSINPKDDFSYTDAFCDSEGNKSDFIAGSDWKVTFNEASDVTTVHVVITHDSLEDLEKIIEMGFKEGFTIGLNQLEELLHQNTTS